ncbi:hypothetical protein [Streptomyces sp. C10-9-1]|uniref:hypothetical protein n=1 Tax=Streptomyces sp. C10-9-1 TaxID=1859285 RepID=UPI003F49EC09
MVDDRALEHASPEHGKANRRNVSGPDDHFILRIEVEYDFVDAMYASLYGELKSIMQLRHTVHHSGCDRTSGGGPA